MKIKFSEERFRLFKIKLFTFGEFRLLLDKLLTYHTQSFLLISGFYSVSKCIIDMVELINQISYNP